MLDLQKHHDEAIANHLQQQQELDDLLPIIEDAGALIVEKMAHLNHSNLQARAEVTQNWTSIWLCVIISNIAPKVGDTAWLKASYTMSDGRLSILTHKLICRDTRADPEEIARHFVTRHQKRIEAYFRRALFC